MNNPQIKMTPELSAKIKLRNELRNASRSDLEAVAYAHLIDERINQAKLEAKENDKK